MKRLLVVDDAMLMRKMIRDLATEAGWDVVGEARDGQEAIELYESLRPDLVTMDLVMPRVTGIEALRAIRSHDPGARVIVVTALDQKQMLMESIHHGAVDFIVKPFDRSRFLEMMRKLAAQESAPSVRTVEDSEVSRGPN
jgi:two-component system chemotaxis response regulator CheY